MDLSLSLMPFQKEGVDLLAKNSRYMLAWEPGVGKTPAAVRACARVGARSILVFCPLIATRVWRKHFLDWSGFSNVRILDASNGPTPYTFLAGAGVCIVPYSRITNAVVMKAAARFSDMWDVVILDEAHYLKNPKAQRTRAIYGPGLDLKNSPLEHAAHIWALTGTPLLNGPHELWTHLRALRPELITQPNLGLMSYTVFVQRYCHVRSTSYGFHVVGAKNTTELVQRIAPFTHRKRAKDVLHDLPPLRVTTYELPPSLIEISPELESAMDDLELEHIDDLDDEDLLRAAQNVSQFSTARRLVGMAKVPGVVVMVDDLLQSGARKLIVFAHHRDVIEQLAQGLTDAGHRPLTIWGGTSQKDRDQFIDAFQDGPERVLLLSIEAASEAITLTAASHVIIAEPSPVPARNVQAIARAHRKGQTRNVLAQFVTLPGTFDQRFMELIARKTRDIMRVLDPDLAAPTLAHVGQQGLLPFPDMEDQPI